MKKEEHIEQLDIFRDAEEENYRTLKTLLGETFDLFPELLRLYELFIELSLDPVLELEGISQPPALLHSLQWMKNEAIAGALTLMRGHITDSSNFSRRALEICAFIVRMYQDKDAAKRWLEAGISNRAQERYTTSFPAWKLVKDLLTPELVKMYEEDCLAVHPSFFAVAKRASLDSDLVHRFKFFDLDEFDENQSFFVVNFFNLCICHSKIMQFLATILNSTENFDFARWTPTLDLFEKQLESQKQIWLPKLGSQSETLL